MLIPLLILGFLALRYFGTAIDNNPHHLYGTCRTAAKGWAAKKEGSDVVLACTIASFLVDHLTQANGNSTRNSFEGWDRVYVSANIGALPGMTAFPQWAHPRQSVEVEEYAYQLMRHVGILQ